MSRLTSLAGSGVVLLLLSASLAAQAPPDLAAERAGYLRWLKTAPNSPLFAVAQQPVGTGLRLGPEDADIPLAGIAEHRLTVDGATLTLEGPTGKQQIGRGRPIRLGDYTLYLSGSPAGPVLTVFGSTSGKQPPGYYPYDPSLVFIGPLLPPERPGKARVLGANGIEIEATEAGTVLVPVGGTTRLRVLRIPVGGEESELEIFFRDSTNGEETYPAGRFLSLVPVGAGKVRLDLNRARNPFCAYSPVYPCPAPWRGNELSAAVRAGERYEGKDPEAERAKPEGSPAGPWKAVLDLVGGPLPFVVEIERIGGGWGGKLCNGSKCEPFSAVRMDGDSLVLEIADYDAIVKAALRADSLTGYYHNVGSNGPRTIPFRAARGRRPASTASKRLVGSWDATYFQDLGTSPRVFELRNGPSGFEGRIISSTSDYGPFAGSVVGDSFAIGLFDGSFVYLLTGKLQGDTLRGIFHAGLRTQTRWQAIRSSGAPHLTSPNEVTSADTTEPLRFGFPDLAGRLVRNDDPGFKGKVVLVDVFGSWCPTCHEGTPELIRLYRRYHGRGLEVVGLAFEATGDTAVDGRQVRRYRDKFGIPFPLLLAGTSDEQAMATALPQLRGLSAFPTTIFLGRDGRVRRVRAGFHGAGAGAQHVQQVGEFEREIERLLNEKT